MRIETVIGAAKVKGITNPETREIWINHHNPAQWKDHLAKHGDEIKIDLHADHMRSLLAVASLDKSS
ncbi:hypothetical protein ACVWWO_003551 [Bradyrhizobium sp. F1.13.1]